MTKDERIALVNADIAAGRIAVQVQGPIAWHGAAPVKVRRGQIMSEQREYLWYCIILLTIFGIAYLCGAR